MRRPCDERLANNGLLVSCKRGQSPKRNTPTPLCAFAVELIWRSRYRQRKRGAPISWKANVACAHRDCLRERRQAGLVAPIACWEYPVGAVARCVQSSNTGRSWGARESPRSLGQSVSCLCCSCCTWRTAGPGLPQAWVLSLFGKQHICAIDP